MAVLRIEEGGRELLRVEVLNVERNREAKFRLWYYKWRETRPHQPYEDFEIFYDKKEERFIGGISVNEADGIYEEHLVEIFQLLRKRGVRGVSYLTRGKLLIFTGVFRDVVLGRIPLKWPRVKPAVVEYLGNRKFRINSYEVEFDFGYTAKLKMPSAEEALRLAASLRRAGVYAKVVRNTVKLNSDSFLGLLAAANVSSPEFTLLYRSDNLHVYARPGDDCLYFAVKYKGLWRAAEVFMCDEDRPVDVYHRRRKIIEALKDAIEDALLRIGNIYLIKEMGTYRDEKGNIVAHYLLLYQHHVTPFFEHAAERVKAEPVEVWLDDEEIVVRAGRAEGFIPLWRYKYYKRVFLFAEDWEQALVLYKSLEAEGVPVEITTGGVMLELVSMWVLLARAVEKAIERGVIGGLPAELAPYIKVLNMYNVGGVKMYVFKVSKEDEHSYVFLVKTEDEWEIAEGIYRNEEVVIEGREARIVADVVNALYSERGVERRVEVGRRESGTPYIRLTNVDLGLLGIKI